MTIEEFAGRFDDVVREGNRYRARCPVHRGAKRSLVVEPGRKVSILVRCWARGCTLDAILAAVGCTRTDLADGVGRSSERVYVLRDAAGAVVAEHVRVSRPNGEKRMFWRRNGTPKLKGLKVTDLPLYGADTLAQTPAGAPTIVTEGEKAKEALSARGLVAVATVTGAATIPCDAVLRQLLAYEVTLWPDNDPDGRRHMQKIARRLLAMGMAPRWLDWPEAPPAGDAADFCGSTEDLQALLATAAPLAAASPAAPEQTTPTTDPAGRPVIVVTDRPLPDLTAAALAALASANDPPHTFARGGTLVRVRCDENDTPLIDVLTESMLRGRLARAAHWVRRAKTGCTTPTPPPLDVVRDLAALDTVTDELPPLRAITEVPIVRPDGSLMTTPGYDASTRLIYKPPRGFVLPAIPARPTAHDVRAATALLDEVFADFPFSDVASRANALGLLVTPFIRPLVTGPVPLAVFSKPRQGTGSTLLATAIIQVVTGRDVATAPAPDRPEEWQKLITALLTMGRSFVLLDNVTTSLGSGHLAHVLTAEAWEDRVLGLSQTIRLSARTIWAVTGNNVQLLGDLPRRAFWIRLDAAMEYPDDRPPEGFRHPELLGWISTHRAALVAAVLTLAMHWISEGRPAPRGAVMGGYDGWVRPVGGLLAAAGISGFLTNRAAMRAETDDDHAAWVGFFAVWFDTFHTTPVRTATVVAAIRTATSAPLIGAPALSLREAVPPSLEDPEDRRFPTRLGTALRTRCNQIFGRLQLRHGSEDGHEKVATWRVHVVSDAGGPGEKPTPAGSADSPPHLRGGENFGEENENTGRIAREDYPHYPHPPQREPGDDDPVVDLAEALGWPMVPLRPGVNIAGSASDWRAFAATASPADRAAARTYLEQLAAQRTSGGD